MNHWNKKRKHKADKYMSMNAKEKFWFDSFNVFCNSCDLL